mmetsp:Transcript_124385/g.348386  ORF Transcript_124385/g.348386 Transcript_124385/m.348386 type:complete len:191 (-) Transcript_124385:429-1001(-)
MQAPLAVVKDGFGCSGRPDASAISRARCGDVGICVITVPPPPTIAELVQELPHLWPSSTCLQQAADPADSRSMVLLQNLPCRMEVGDVCRLLDQLGFMCAYNVVSMSTGKRRSRRNKRWAMVNFLWPCNAVACIDLCNGMVLGDARSRVTCSATLAEVQSGSFVAESLSKHLRRQTAAPPWCRICGGCLS